MKIQSYCSRISPKLFYWKHYLFNSHRKYIKPFRARKLISTFTSCFYTKNCALPSDCIYAFSMILSISREYFPRRQKMAGRCDGDVVCFASKAKTEFLNKIQTRFMFIILMNSIIKF